MDFEDLMDAALEAFEAKELQHAVEMLTDALRMNPDNVEALSLRGASFYLQGEWSGALSDLCRAVNVRPSSPLPYLWRGTLFQHAKRYAEAFKDFTQVLKNGFCCAQVYRHRAMSRVGLNDWLGAYQDLVDARNLDPTRNDIDCELAHVRHELKSRGIKKETSITKEESMGRWWGTACEPPSPAVQEFAQTAAAVQVNVNPAAWPTNVEACVRIRFERTGPDDAEVSRTLDRLASS